MDVTTDNSGAARSPLLFGGFLKGVVGFFGLSAILYGCGFVALRSEANFLGIWTGATVNSSEVVDEGGRFFYQMTFMLASPFASYSKRTFVFVVLLTIAWIGRRILPRYPGAGRRELLRWIPPVLVAAGGLVLTAMLLGKMWLIAGYGDVLRSGAGNLAVEMATQQSRYATYEGLCLRLLVAATISWLLVQGIWTVGALAERALVLAQCLLVIAGILVLPIMYGRLVLPHAFPTFMYGESPDQRLLLGQDSGNWIVWNRSHKLTEVLPKGKELVTIGQRQSVLDANRKEPIVGNAKTNPRKSD